jgi:UDP-glucose 4-epimerase
VIVASSSEVYGEPTRNPIVESDPTHGKSVYAISKLAVEELTKGYNQLYPWLNYTIVRFFNTYGEGQVAQFVISRFVKQVLEGQDPVIYGDGNQIRSYGHVDDVTTGLNLILGNPDAYGKTYNLGNSGQVLTLKELAQIVIDTLAPNSGLSVKITDTFAGTDRDPQREIYARYCDTTKAFDELGYKPSITVAEGVQRIAASGKIEEDWPFTP